MLHGITIRYTTPDGTVWTSLTNNWARIEEFCWGYTCLVNLIIAWDRL